MASKWRKAKLALGLNLCYYVPKSATTVKHDDDDDDWQPVSETFSGAALLSDHAPINGEDVGEKRSSTPVRVPISKSSSSRSSSSSKKICSICLERMKLGEGEAIFTAECTHSFHFHCIISNVKHGNQVCPVCRAKWKEFPRDNNNTSMTLIRRLPPSYSNRPTTTTTTSTRPPPLLYPREPAIYDDDESLVQPPTVSVSDDDRPSSNLSNSSDTTTVEIKTYPEFSVLEKSKPYSDFTVLIHLKAPHQQLQRQHRTPVDLVTVLDVSGSMSGTKLTLLKQAMKFVIQNLTPNDRLSVIAFSSTARRLFPLSRMTTTGKQHAINSITSLTATGGTNIAEGLRKGVKLIEQRKECNPVASIILLSDGQDTYSTTLRHRFGGRRKDGKESRRSSNEMNYRVLLPVSIQKNDVKVPIHTLGFGIDHDSNSMHSIAEYSSGMFSFIESQDAIQDAFAQCIGGILSVVVQNLQLRIQSSSFTNLVSITSGSYENSMTSDGKIGSINVGDLYADEERDFLVSLSIPHDSTSLMNVTCEFTNPTTNKSVTLHTTDEVKITRTDDDEKVYDDDVCAEVDRQRNRIRAATAMTEARSAAERGELDTAITILKDCRKVMSMTKSGKCEDKMCVGLDIEMKEMQERMRSKQVYEDSGRAYVLSGLSSHSWQRATVRGDSSGTYQTPSMVEMVSKSQEVGMGSSGGNWEVATTNNYNN